MKIPASIVLGSSLQIGAVYKIKAPELIDTDIPHYFIVIAIDEEDNYLMTCTTQVHSRADYIRKMNYNSDTLCFLSPCETNGLTKTSYIDCNQYHLVTKQKLVEKIENDELQIKGRLELEEYNKIKKSIGLSIVNDIPDFLLFYQ